MDQKKHLIGVDTGETFTDTVATNATITRQGRKVGFITTKYFEDALIDDNALSTLTRLYERRFL